jgi:hypothetical protein
MMLERAFLIICAVAWLPYGVLCFLDPTLLAESAGVEATTATGTTVLRAMYGGLQGAVGVLAMIAVFRPTIVQSFLVALLTLSAGLLSARVIGFLVDGGYTGYTGMAIGFETVLLSCCIYFLLRRRAIHESKPTSQTMDGNISR